MNFAAFKEPVRKQFDRMTKSDMFCVEVDRDALWDRYLTAFPRGTNPVFRSRAEYDCTCCRQFVKAVGSVVTVVDGEVKTIWDAEFSEPAFQAVADAMAEYVRSKPIAHPFLYPEKQAGTDKSRGEVDGEIKTFEHFHVRIPFAQNQGPNYYCAADQIPTKLGAARTLHDVFLRSLNEISLWSIDTTLELITQGSIYRGEEHKGSVEAFRTVRVEYIETPEAKRDAFAWSRLSTVPVSVARIKNTAIGTLLCDLSEGVSLEKAVTRFEKVMAPDNYKRPTALVTKAMVDKAREAVEALGLTTALDRRYAELRDVSVNDILFVDRTSGRAMKDDVFSAVQTRAEKPKNLDRVEDIGIEQFLTLLGRNRIDSIEVMVENRHLPNLVSLVAPQHRDSPPLLKWDNGFSWSYNGELTDSVKERVKKAGGNVTGDLCCRLAWYNHDDLDLHMHEPRHYHLYYGTKHSTSPAGGRLDVDMNAGGLMSREPVENIFYASRRTMASGTYKLVVDLFSRRENANGGFEVELDWLGVTTRYSYEKQVKGQVPVVTFKYSDSRGVYDVEHHLPSTQRSTTTWGLTTETYHRVSVLMLSPNHWEGLGNPSGNKHWFFMIDGCLNDGQARGFFNEFLRPELAPHSKVIEMVGAGSKVAPTPNQLSGLGFSSTQRNELLVRVKGSFTRTLKVQF